MATEPEKTTAAEKTAAAEKPKGFQPVELVRGDRRVTAETPEQEAKLRWDGFRSAPSGKKPAAKTGSNPS
jgi:hypothetical protein